MGVATFNWLPQGTGEKLWDVVRQSWALGFTAFGGPPVHFKIVRNEPGMMVPRGILWLKS